MFRNNQSAITNNFRILHTVLSNVGVKFSTNMAKNIIEKKPGVISNLLYEIRSNLEKKGVNPDNISLKKSSHFQEMYAPMKFRQEIPQYDAFESKHFLEVLQKKIKSQQDIDLEKKLKRFEDFKIEQTKKIQEDIIQEEIMKKHERDLNIKNHRNKNQRYHAFLQQFEEKGINNWKNNMLRAKKREMKDITFELEQAKRINQNIQRTINKNANDYIKNVARFEATFGDKKHKVKPSSQDDVAYEATQDNNNNNIDTSDPTAILINTNNPGLLFKDEEIIAEQIRDEIFTKMMVDPKVKTERNRRRRKIIVEQGKAQLEIENRRREEQYIGKLAKQSNQEKQLTYEVYRVNQCKNIIMENRALREQRYKDSLDKNINFAVQNEQNFLEFHVENYKRELEKEENRKKDLEISLKQKRRNLNSDACERMIKLIIDIADEAYIYQQINDSEEIDERVWREWTNIFINDQSVLDNKNKEQDDTNVNVMSNKADITNNEEDNKSSLKDDKDKSQLNEDNNNNNEQQSNKGSLHEDNTNNNNNGNSQEDNIKDDDFNPDDVKSKYNNTFYSVFNPDAKSTELDQILDECEFNDYVNYLGQWNTKLIPETAFITLTPSDLQFEFSGTTTTQDQTANTKGAGKAGKNVNTKNQNKDTIDDIMKEETPENLKIPEQNLRNVYLGDLIDILIEMKYQKDENPLPDTEIHLSNNNSQQKIEQDQDQPQEQEATPQDIEKEKQQKELQLQQQLKQQLKLQQELLEKKQRQQNIFRYIPIKIALIGQDFSGKKTQAKILSENFPFKIYDFKQLAKNALGMLNQKSDTQSNFLLSASLAATNGNLGNEQIQGGNTIAQMRTEQAQEEERYAKIKELANAIKSKLLNGEPISDDIYADLLIEYIKIDFPYKDDNEVIDEIIDRVSRKEKIEEDIEINKEQNSNRPIAFAKREKELEDEKMRISLEASKGFVVVNYPNTYNQAKILETKLSGYVSQSDSPKLKSSIMKDAFAIVLDKSEKIYPPVKLLQGGFDFVFYLNVPAQECIRRAIGRRSYLDKKTNKTTIYHLQDNPPPTDSNICENLCKIEDITNCESSLVTRHLAFSTAVDHVVEFYQPFGFEKDQLKSFEEIDGNRGKDYVTQDLIYYLNKLVEINERNDKEIYDKHEQESFEEDEEDGGENIIGLNDKSGDGEGIDIGNVGNDNKDEQGKEKDKDVLSKSEHNKSSNNNNNNVDDSIGVAKDNEEQQQQEMMMNKEPEDEYTQYITKINRIKATLNKELSENLLKTWTNIFANYVNECKSVFKFLRVQREEINSNYNLICQKFIDFLKRPSKKQILLLDYQMKYNKFIDDYPDLKDEPQVKEEHHQEVDDLNDKIYEIIETRKNEAIDERKKIMTSGWIENEMEKFYMSLSKLFQNEIDKFIGSLQIIRDYYHNLDNRPLIDLPFTTVDIIKDEADTSIPIEAFSEGTDPQSAVMPDMYPRLDKLYKTALKVQFQYEEAIRESEKERKDKMNEANKKNAAATKGKKGADKTQAQSPLDEPSEDTYAHNAEMKEALTNEKAKYRYKITLLKHWGIFVLTNIRKISLSVYDKLEDWIILAIKAENEALNQLTFMLKENIEKEEKIKYELALETFDIIINMDVQNYIELPPQPLPAKEVIDHNKFNITQLRILMEELQIYLLEDNESIRSSTFVSIFIKKYISSKNESDVYYGIPDLLRNLSYYNYFKFIKRLDPKNTDLISLKQIGTYFCLLNCVVPSEDKTKDIIKQLEEVINYYESPEVTLEQFVNIKFWFDEQEKSLTLPNHEDYHRDVKLKEILFDINKTEGDVVNMNEFINIINLKKIGLDADKLEAKTYYEVLFY